MMQMMEFQLPLEGTPEQQEAFKKSKKPLIVTATVVMPAMFSIKRIGGRITIHEKVGIHPETKQIGKFGIAEEGAYIWAECDPLSAPTPRTFYVIANGLDIPENLTYVGSFLLQSGQLIFHLYGEKGTTYYGQ